MRIAVPTAYGRVDIDVEHHRDRDTYTVNVAGALIDVAAHTIGNVIGRALIEARLATRLATARRVVPLTPEEAPEAVMDRIDRSLERVEPREAS